MSDSIINYTEGCLAEVYTVGIKLIVYGQGSGWSWLGGMVNGLTSFLVLHSTTCGYVCISQQVGQSNTMKEHTQTLISATYFP